MGPSPRTAATPGEMDAPAALTDRGQAGCRGAPSAAPQPATPPLGRAVARAHQPRIPLRSDGEAERGRPADARVLHQPRTGRFVSRSGAPNAPRSLGPIRPLQGQLQPDLVSWGPPPVRAGKPRRYSAS
ncbi:hypothetical protein NDU88_003612 [Pleurodeles waltl]|uniref:Uncharacterized protein n=1 Tax=Pleurodeles waltl TaxID=8319 RepID=A0AAV7LFV3_PLEWA|nr:hypothetical protein NDU88_003612 [Pleurodeles waltl]